MADKDKKLMTALNDAKKRKMYFAFIPKGTSDGKLIVSKKKIPKAEIEQAKTELKVKIAVIGKCAPSPDNGGLTFEVVKDPGASVGSALKNVIKRDANAIKSEFFVVEDAETDLPPALEGEGESTGAPPEAPPIPKPLDPAIAEAKDKVTKRLETVIGPFKEAITNKAPEAGQMQALMTTFKDAIAKQKYDDAGKALDQLEP